MNILYLFSGFAVLLGILMLCVFALSKIGG